MSHARRLGAADVSVIITVFNNAPTIGEAIESVLSQTRPPGEVLVIDDGSTDGSGDIARAAGPRVRVLSQENRGISASRNRGVSETSGALIAAVDADDRWATNKLERQLDVLSDDVDAVSCHVAQVPEAEWSATVSRQRPAGVVLAGPVWSSLVLRRTAFARIGEFDPAYRLAEQIDWWARAHEAGLRIATVAEPLLFRRLHAENHGIRQRAHREEYARAVHAALQRRRRLAAEPNEG